MGDHSHPTRLTVEQPTRDADRNRSLSNKTDPRADEMLLPSLKDGITLLDVKESRGVPILHSLVLDHLLLHDGPAFWVDANGYATTTTLAQIAPSQRLLDRIHVARGFTAYQHYSAVCDLPTAVNRSIDESIVGTESVTQQTSQGDRGTDAHTPSLIIAPAVDAQYQADDTLRGSHAKTLHTRALARLSRYADAYDVPVLVTRSGQNEFTASVARVADHRLACEQTRMGPRIVGDDFETLLYPIGDGTYYQTTFAYWRHLLAARAKQVGLQPSPTPSSAGTGRSLTATGETAVATPDPLLDAWTASAGGR